MYLQPYHTANITFSSKNKFQCMLLIQNTFLPIPRYQDKLLTFVCLRTCIYTLKENEMLFVILYCNYI